MGVPFGDPLRPEGGKVNRRYAHTADVALRQKRDDRTVEDGDTINTHPITGL